MDVFDDNLIDDMTVIKYFQLQDEEQNSHLHFYDIFTNCFKDLRH